MYLTIFFFANFVFQGCIIFQSHFSSGSAEMPKTFSGERITIFPMVFKNSISELLIAPVTVMQSMLILHFLYKNNKIIVKFD